MSRKVTGSPSLHRKFDVASEIGHIKGILDTVVKYIKSEPDRHEEILELIACMPTSTTMSEIKHLRFSGRADESVDTVINKLKFAKVANNWSDDQLYAHAVLTLHDAALVWFEEQGEAEFTPADGNKPTFTRLAEKMKEKFKADQTQGDMLSEILLQKQKRGQAVDSYLGEILPKLSKLNLGDEVKTSLLVNGFTPSIQEKLKFKDVKTMNDAQLWAKRIEKMTFTKTLSQDINETEAEVAVLHGKQNKNVTETPQNTNNQPQKCSNEARGRRYAKPQSYHGDKTGSSQQCHCIHQPISSRQMYRGRYYSVPHRGQYRGRPAYGYHSYRGQPRYAQQNNSSYRGKFEYPQRYGYRRNFRSQGGYYRGNTRGGFASHMSSRGRSNYPSHYQGNH